MSTTTEIDPNGYEAITSFWQFDRKFYEDIGLDLSPLESDSADGLMPMLRRAASLVVAAQESKTVSTDQLGRAHEILLDRHSKVGKAMAVAERAVHHASIDVGHPAVVSWQDRNEQAEKSDRRPITELVGRVDWFHIGLVRPHLPEDPEYHRAPFSPVSRPNANFYHSPVEVANQLTLARVGVWFDI